MSASPGDSKELTPYQKEGRERWTHEDHLINHRLTWLGATQTILFAAQGIVVQQLAANEKAKLEFPSCPNLSDSSKFNSYHNLLEQFQKILPLVGLISSFLIFSGVIAATVAMIRIKKSHDLPTYGVSTLTSVGGWISASGLPFLFMCAWSRVMNSDGVLIACIALMVATILLWRVEYKRNENDDNKGK